MKGVQRWRVLLRTDGWFSVEKELTARDVNILSGIVNADTTPVFVACTSEGEPCCGELSHRTAYIYPTIRQAKDAVRRFQRGPRVVAVFPPTKKGKKR